MKRSHRAGLRSTEKSDVHAAPRECAPGPEQPRRRWLRCSHVLPTAVIFFLALAMRIAYLIDSSDYPAFRIPISDAFTYDLRARELAGGHGMSGEFFWQPVFYPVWLALIYLFDGGSIVGAKVLQVILGAATCALTQRLGRRLLGPAAGLVAGFIAAFYGPLIFYEAELLAPGWAAFWSVAILLLLLRVRERPSIADSLGLGVAAGLSVLTRPEFLPFLLAAGVWLGWKWLRTVRAAESPRTAQSRALASALILAGFALPTVSTALQCYRTTGRFTFLPASGGVNFYIGNHPHMCRMLGIWGTYAWNQLTGEPVRHGVAPDMWSHERYFYEQARGNISADPGGALVRLVRKTLQYVNSYEIPRNEDVYVIRDWSSTQRALTWRAGLLGFPFGVLLPLAFIGVYLCGPRLGMPVLLFLILYPAMSILVFVTARYRAPIVPALAVAAAGACVEIWRTVRARHWRCLAFGAAIGTVAVLITTYRGALCERNHDFRASLYVDIGYHHSARGDEPAAMASYQEALRLKPDYAEAHVNFGNALAGQGRFAEALPHLEAAVRQAPDLALIHQSYASALVGLKRAEEAIASLRHAVELDSACTSCRKKLGVLLMQAGQTSEGIAEFRAAVRLTPGDFEAQFNLGSALRQTGDRDGCIEAYRAAALLSPSSPQVHFQLGIAFEEAGRLDQAAREYQAVLRTEPRNADAQQRYQRLLTSRPAP